MRNRTLNLQITAIFAIIIVSFAGCALFFSYLNTNSLKVSAETETDLSAIMFTSSIRDNIPVTEIEYHVSGTGAVESRESLPEELEDTLYEILSDARDELGEDLDVWIVNKAGKIYFSSTGSTRDDEIEYILNEEFLTKAFREAGGGSSVSMNWIGRENRLLFNQSLCAVRTVYADRLYLVMLNRCSASKALQRSQLVLFAGMELALMFVMVVLIANTLFSYRRQLIKLATVDELTGLSNRKYFNAAYREYASQDKRREYSLFLVDIDFFKQINDTYGHATGDLALRTLADHIKDVTAGYGGFAGRWGGDEFIGVLPLDGSEAEAVLDEFCGRVRSELITLDSAADADSGDMQNSGAPACFNITVSVGTAEACGQESLSSLSEKADKALYASKKDGRDRVTLYYPELEELDPAAQADSAGKDGTSKAASREAASFGSASNRAAGGAAWGEHTPAAASSNASYGSGAAEYGTAAASTAAFRTAAGTNAGRADVTDAETDAADGNVTAAGNDLAANAGRTDAAAGTAAARPDAGVNIGRADRNGAKTAAAGDGGSSFGKRLLSYIKNNLLESTVYGVRWMAPFVAGGGMLIGLAFLFDAASIDMASLSVEARSNFGSITETAAVLKSIGDTTFNFMLPVFAGFMAYGIAGESAFMAGFVGGYMTINSHSGFIGAMVAGFFAGVMALELQKFLKHFPLLIRKAAPIIIYPVFNLIIMEALSVIVITPISSAIGGLFTVALDAAWAKGTVLAGTLASAMMSIDMGGIINKVAYNYGVAGLGSGGTQLMACVMAGGMVPPLGIALSILMYRRSFNDDERERGPGTLFMGFCFITEGALPYVFEDIKRVIPSCIAGSALAGCLSAIFGCELPAPHGGIFVLPVMEHPVFYLVALAAGAGLTAVILGNWKQHARRNTR